ncbi:DUF6221 family protein [Streptomyces sp. NPDC002809]|uniref:DUF6221 family protein n=1 Tax=Streptomyces sp. NPDC002809 TaxID=3154433 RepID=UPI0033271349
MTDDLVQFLRDRLDEDERIARAAGSGWYDYDPEQQIAFVPPEDSRHIARHDPARVLREVEAGKRMLHAYDVATHGERTAPHEDQRDVSGAKVDSWRFALRLLALSYADYRDDWRP